MNGVGDRYTDGWLILGFAVEVVQVANRGEWRRRLGKAI